MEHKIISNPPINWMERITRNHWVWLVKENQPAQIEFPYEPPEPGFIIGRVGIRRFSLDENRYLDMQSWHISADGEGIDGSQLILPTEGNLLDNPICLPEPIVRQFQRAIEHLEQKVRSLEQILMVE